VGVVAGVGWWLGLVGAVAGAAVAWWFVHRTPDRAIAAIGATPLRGASRLENLVEGLCLANGIPVPRLMVVESSAFNTCAIGLAEPHATLVVTRGLLDGLGRIELEAVVARQLALVKGGHAALGTLVAGVASVWSGASDRLVPERSDVVADIRAVGLTRYPPGLLDALAKIESDPVLASAPGWTRHLWIEDPVGPAAGRPGSSHSPIDERLATLREL
jgi:heat shock protein HtpX